MPPKLNKLPPSGFSEPSEPSDLSPEQNPRSQLTSNQEENPQIIAQNPGYQRKDYERNGRSMAGWELEDAKNKEVDNGSYDYEGVLDTVKRKFSAVKAKL
ncbi:hypothetical protein NLI96_g1148 [Meripilus lineatus]|uniref:Uncharacterized protein n=1 Tax=Meripilus lineatus TaxID=2056292 RepID=A0AAD5YIN8_9APHY|nr:hypothetical protein NLI96_g1148 [Physisporinus lineatus]